MSQLQYKDNGALESGIGTMLTLIVMSWLHTFMEYITTTMYFLWEYVMSYFISFSLHT